MKGHCDWVSSKRRPWAVSARLVHPLQSGVFLGFERAPWSTRVDHFGLEQPDDNFGHRVVVRVTHAADRSVHAIVSQTLGVTNGQILHATVALMDQSGIHLTKMRRQLRRIGASSIRSEFIDRLTRQPTMQRAMRRALSIF